MIFRRPEPLSERAQRLLAVERRIEPEAAERRQRVLSRARASLREPHASPRFGLFSRVRFGVVLALLLGFGAVAYAAWDELRGAPPAPDHVGVATGGLTEQLARWTVVPASPRAVPDAETVDVPEQRPAPPSSSRGFATEADELSLLRRARLELAQGEPRAALRAIAQHQRRFPSTPLREEREALRVQALYQLGKTDEARRAADRFHERYPRSVLAPGDGTGGGSGP